MTDENGVTEEKKDMKEEKKMGIRTEQMELEEEIKELERQLKHERSDRRKTLIEAQEDMDRELQQLEDKWAEKTHRVMAERDELLLKIEHMEEEMENLRIDVNRAVAYRLEMEESRNRLKDQLDSVQRDYEETMQERSIVLEENTRMSEEMDRLKENMNTINTNINQQQNEEIKNLANKLEHSRRLLQLNMEETASANISKNDALERIERIREECTRIREERDEAIKRTLNAQSEREPIVDVWNTHTLEISFPYPKQNLGIVLSGGITDDRYSVHTPIYVKEVLIGSPLELYLKRLDHILIVNDIDVTDMDQRSVIDILKNSHCLKMVIRRRANAHKIQEITIRANQDIGLELGNGVFVNGLDSYGRAARSGIQLGYRIVHVNNIPVYDAKHAEQLIKYSNGQVLIGLLDGKKRIQPQAETHKQKSTLLSKLFGRHNMDRSRSVVAKANIDSRQLSSFYRQGSLRIPTQGNSGLVRYGSLRAPPGSVDHNKIVEELDHYLKKNENHASTINGNIPWPSSVPEEESIVPRRRHLNRPSVIPVFANSSTPIRLIRQPSEASTFRSCISPSPCSRVNPHTTQSLHSRHVTSPSNSHRMSTYSSALPQPPPYPGPRDDSLSSILSSNNSLPHPSTSSVNIPYHNYANNSPSGTLLSEASDKVRRICLNKEGNEFGLGLENSNGGGVVISNVQGRANGLVRRGDRLLDVGGINMRSADKEAASKVLNHFGASHDEVTLLVSGHTSPHWIQVARKSVRLCGGNAIGILAEESASELQEGDLILEIDGFNVRGATLEEATEALLESLSEMTELLIEDGGDRLNRLRLGADGDSFYVRINVDRNSENKDELDIKAGEIVFVDKTLFMGQSGRWRAWKIDREGRQRENGIIPAATYMERNEQKNRKNRNRAVLTRPIYERVEKISSSRRRPVVLFGALIAPFVQALLDDSNKFGQCVPECRALDAMDVERMLSSQQLIEARRRDQLFDVISANAVRSIVDSGLHCLVDVSPSGIQRMHALRLYPIVIKIKFKSSKQVKEMKEDCMGERLSSKQAKELMDKASQIENELEAMKCSVSTVIVSSQGLARVIIKQVCQQISAHIDHEQKKTIWVACA